jgi:hypothetical protein
VGREVLLEQFRVLVFEFSDDVFVEEEGGDGEVGTGEVLVELGLLDEIPNHEMMINRYESISFLSALEAALLFLLLGDWLLLERHLVSLLLVEVLLHEEVLALVDRHRLQLLLGKD